MIRAHKTTPEADAARVMIFGTIMAICILIGLDPAIRVFEEYGSHRPWIVPTIEIVASGDEKPDFIYKAVARFPVHGTWTTYLEDTNNRRLCGGSGQGKYRPNDKPAERWEWTAWLGTDCALPKGEFRACVFYAVETNRGTKDTTDPVCSPPYDPRKTK